MSLSPNGDREFDTQCRISALTQELKETPASRAH